MALPLPPNTKSSLGCKLKYVCCVVIQEIKAIKTVLVFPWAINRGGTNANNINDARYNLNPAEVILGAGTNIDWKLSNIFRDSITTNKVYTMSNTLAGIVPQVVLSNGTGAPLTPQFPAAVIFPSGIIGTTIPAIAAGKRMIYTFTHSNGITFGVIAGPYNI